MTGLRISSEGFGRNNAAASPSLHAGGSSRVWARAIKQAVDISVSAIGLLFLAPLFALIGLLIALDSPGDVFYRQPRLGRHGQVFELIKFRTMRRGAESELDTLLLDAQRQEEWQHYQKLRQDPRITRLGRWLRGLGLDELPQLWNVLQGEMSLVGPRPIIVDQRNLYGAAYAAYVQVLPGITGLWQVTGGNRLSFARRAELDMEYVLHWSIWKDLDIARATLKAILVEHDLC